MDIQTRRLRTIEQLRAFVEGNEPVIFQPENRDGAYTFIGETLTRFDYRRLGRADKGVVLRFLVAVTGFSRQQLEAQSGTKLGCTDHRAEHAGDHSG